jgi:hypothetical protein
MLHNAQMRNPVLVLVVCTVLIPLGRHVPRQDVIPAPLPTTRAARTRKPLSHLSQYTTYSVLGVDTLKYLVYSLCPSLIVVPVLALHIQSRFTSSA